DPAARAIFSRDGALLAEGERLVQKDLAGTLRRVAAEGPRGFYEGPVALALERAVRRAGGVLAAGDLASYPPVLPDPSVGTYRGRRILAFPPPSSGGVVLLQILSMLERHDLRASGAGSSTSIHLLVEAMRRGFADRSRWIGDPAFFRNPLRGLLDPDYL